MLFTISPDKGIAVPLYAVDAALPFALPAIRRKGGIPGAKERFLIQGKADVRIGCRHIERGAGHRALGGVRRLHCLTGKFDPAGAEGGRLVRQCGQIVVGTGRVDGADGGKDIVQVRACGGIPG